MRMRRKPWARQELKECRFFIDEPTKIIGKWYKSFIREQQIHLELGCGKGGFIAKLASKNLDINYIGIDIKSEVLGLAKRNVEMEYLKSNKQIDNILLTAWEIALIENILNKNDIIDRIYINFCNPWPKPKHNKRRLTYTRQLEKYKTFLKEDGEIYFKTDDIELFEASIKYFEEAGFKIIKKTYDLSNERDIENIQTEHEKMFEKQGIKTKALIAKRKYL